MTDTWEGKLILYQKWSTNKTRTVKEICETVEWTSDIRRNKGILSIFGILINRFLALNCKNLPGVAELLESWASPPILNPDGKIVHDGEMIEVLIREQGYLKECINNLLSDRPHSEKRESWLDSSGHHVAMNRLRRVSIEPGVLYIKGRKKINRTIDGINADKKILNARISLLEDFNNMTDTDEIKKCKSEIIDLEKEIMVIATAKWEPTFFYVSHDALALLWMELYYAAQNNLTAKMCRICGRYFLNQGRRDKSCCHKCKLPKSRIPAAQLNPVEIENRRLRDRLYKQYQRDKISFNEVNRQLRRAGLREISTR